MTLQAVTSAVHLAILQLEARQSRFAFRLDYTAEAASASNMSGRLGDEAGAARNILGRASRRASLLDAAAFEARGRKMTTHFLATGRFERSAGLLFRATRRISFRFLFDATQRRRWLSGCLSGSASRGPAGAVIRIE